MAERNLNEVVKELVSSGPAESLTRFEGYWGPKNSPDGELKRLDFSKCLINFAQKCGIKTYGGQYYYFFPDSEVWENISIGFDKPTKALVQIYNALMRELGLSDTRVGDKYLRTECFIDVIDQQELEVNGNFVAFSNGVLDLQKALRGDADAFGGFSRDYPVVSQMPYDYDPAAKCPWFERFMAQVLPDETRRSLVQMYLGGASFVTTRAANAQKCIFMYGDGANGKGVIYNILQGVLGEDTIVNMQYDDLIERGQGGQFNRMQLVGKKICYMTDTNPQEIMDKKSALFKALISGEPQQVRTLFKSAIKLKIVPWIVINANGLPQKMEDSFAATRRMMFVHFGVSIPEEKQDRQLAEKIVAAESAGVFNWLLRGAREIIRRKWCFPESPDNEEIYRRLRPMEYWLRENHYSLEPTYSGEQPEWVQSTDLMDQYIYWREQYNMPTDSKSVNAKSFGTGMRKYGFNAEGINWKHIETGNYYRCYGHKAQQPS